MLIIIKFLFSKLQNQLIGDYDIYHVSQRELSYKSFSRPAIFKLSGKGTKP